MATSAAPRRKVPAKGTSARYTKVKFLGDGQFGTVFLEKDVVTGQEYAIKQIRMGDKQQASEGLHPTAIREIKFLQELHHPNIIELHDIFAKKSNVNLVFELAFTDLEVIIRDKSLMLHPGDIKAFFLQSMLGLEYMHACWILHRDIKPNNILVTSQGVVKVTDFGLACSYGSPTRPMTTQVVTIFYRCPELLLGCKHYGTSVDIWAMGCVLAELELRVPLLQGTSDLDQLNRIFELRGAPTEETWPGYSKLANAWDFQATTPTPLRSIMPAASDNAIELMENLLTCDPNQRMTATQALKHKYFSSAPGPTPNEQLPLPAKPQINEATVRKQEEVAAPGTAVSKLATSGEPMPKKALFE
eukprot:m.72856 g.72856  ORF g.72856 m.72856 type:complete len:359 (-) comp14287_c0_seq2:79-1155(-)